MPSLTSLGSRAGMALGLGVNSSGFSPQTNLFLTGSGNVTIPVGATTVTIETWGGGGHGGASSGFTLGQCGGAGGYALTVLNISGHSGQTIHYSVGAGAQNVSVNGGGTSVTSGSYVITTMTAGGGFTGNLSTGGAGGTASGGNTTNTTGNTGSAPGSGNTPGVVGIGGASYGAGGDGFPFGGVAGDPGAAKFVFT